MGALQDLWDEVEHAVADSLGNAEGRASAWYLEHHFNKAGLGVYRLPDHPIDDLVEKCRRWCKSGARPSSDEALALVAEIEKLRDELART